MSRTRLLLDLQKLDLTRDAAVARLNRIAAALATSPAVAEAEAAIRAAEASLAAADRTLRTLTAEREDLQTHVNAEEQKLYGGGFKNPREVQNLQRETESLKRRLATLEDGVLEAMLARDAADADMGQARQRLAAAERDGAARHADLAEAQSKLSAAVRKVDARRASLLAAIPPADHAIYERLRRAKAGRAVAELDGRACGTCGMEIPVEEAHRAADGSALVYCSGCGRVLHG